MKLTIEITLGNEAMRTFADVIQAQRSEYSSFVDRDEPLAKGDSGSFRDINGNTVGTWEVQD